MTDPARHDDGAQPVPFEAPGLPPPVDLGTALNQMAGLVLSRETVDTALELVTTLAAATTAGTLGAAVTVVDEHGKRSRAASNTAVEQAKGVLMERHKLTAELAFRLLAEASMHANRKLRDVAEHLVLTGELTLAPPGRRPPGRRPPTRRAPQDRGA